METKRTSGNSLITDGVISFFAGIMLFFLMGISQNVLVFAFASYAMILGITQMVAADGERDENRNSNYLMLLGAYSIIAGIVLMFFMNSTLTTVITAIATYVAITGIAEMVAAFRYRSEMGGYSWLVSAGVIRIVFGVFLLMNTTMVLTTFILAFATYALLEGVAMGVFGYEVKYQIGKHSAITLS